MVSEIHRVRLVKKLGAVCCCCLKVAPVNGTLDLNKSISLKNRLLSSYIFNQYKWSSNYSDVVVVVLLHFCEDVRWMRVYDKPVLSYSLEVPIEIE